MTLQCDECKVTSTELKERGAGNLSVDVATATILLCPDCMKLAIPTLEPYRPRDNVLAFHASTDKHRRLLGPYRTGKSHACAAEFVAMMTGVPIPEAPQTTTLCKRGVIIGHDYENALFMFQKIFGSELGNSPGIVPRRLIKKIRWWDKASDIPEELTLTNGSVITLHSSKMAFAKQDHDIDVVWVDEVDQHNFQMFHPSHAFMWSQYLAPNEKAVAVPPFTDFLLPTPPDYPYPSGA